MLFAVKTGYGKAQESLLPSCFPANHLEKWEGWGELYVKRRCYNYSSLEYVSIKIT